MIILFIGLKRGNVRVERGRERTKMVHISLACAHLYHLGRERKA